MVLSVAFPEVEQSSADSVEPELRVLEECQIFRRKVLVKVKSNYRKSVGTYSHGQEIDSLGQLTEPGEITQRHQSPRTPD